MSSLFILRIQDPSVRVGESLPETCAKFFVIASKSGGIMSSAELPCICSYLDSSSQTTAEGGGRGLTGQLPSCKRTSEFEPHLLPVECL